MRARYFCSVLASTLVIGLVFLTSVATAGQHSETTKRSPTLSSKTTRTWTAPRTPWGDPDMQGVYTNIDELNIPIERPAQFEGRKAEESTAEEMAEFTRQSNETRRRTYEQVGGLHHRYDRRAA